MYNVLNCSYPPRPPWCTGLPGLKPQPPSICILRQITVELEHFYSRYWELAEKSVREQDFEIKPPPLPIFLCHWEVCIPCTCHWQAILILWTYCRRDALIGQKGSTAHSALHLLDGWLCHFKQIILKILATTFFYHSCPLLKGLTWITYRGTRRLRKEEYKNIKEYISWFQPLKA